MNIIRETNNEILTIKVEGRIDSSTAPELESEIKNDITNCKKLVFDFKNLDYISSAGLRILLGAQKIMGRSSMKVINVNEAVDEIFEVTGFSFVLNIQRI